MAATSLDLDYPKRLLDTAETLHSWARKLYDLDLDERSEALNGAVDVLLAEANIELDFLEATAAA